jgi:hypothetical protein
MDIRDLASPVRDCIPLRIPDVKTTGEATSQ